MEPQNFVNIHFNEKRWQEVEAAFALWWQRKLDRPLVQIEVTGCPSKRKPPKVPRPWRDNSHDLRIPAEYAIDAWDYELSCHRYLGDAFPIAKFNIFAPGVTGLFCGAYASSKDGVVWLHPIHKQAITEMDITFRAENAWLARIKELYRSAEHYWQGSVLCTMLDLGNPLDTLSALRPSVQLHYDLIEHPSSVEKCIWQLHDCWWRVFREVEDLLMHNRGYSSWIPFFSKERFGTLQCDFAYMIGPDMFDRFVKPELEATCHKLTHSFYHLDGVGQLNHLDSLLSIEKLDGVQWHPGAGSGPPWKYPEVYRAINEAGKLSQGNVSLEAIEPLLDILDNPGTIMLSCTIPFEKADKACRILERIGVPNTRIDE